MIRSMIHKLTRNTSLLTMLDQAIVSGSNFFIAILLARYLGLERYGSFVLMWLAVQFASSLHKALFTAPLHALGPKQSKLDHWLKGVVPYLVMIGLVAGGLTLIAAGIGRIWALQWLRMPHPALLSAVISVFLVNDGVKRILFLKRNVGLAIAMDSVAYLLQLPIFLWFQLNDGLDIQRVLMVLLVLNTGSAFIGLYGLKPGFNLIDALMISRTFLVYARYLIATSILQWFAGNYFVLVGGAILGTTAIGVVKIAQNVMGVLNVLFLALENIIPIRAAGIMHQSGIEGVMNYFKKNSFRLFVPFGLTLALLGFFRQELLSLLYGAEGLASTNYLLGFTLIYVLVFIGTQIQFLVRTIERNQVVFWGYVVSAMASMLSAKMLIESFGTPGILIGMGGAQILTITLYITLLKNELKWLFR